MASRLAGALILGGGLAAAAALPASAGYIASQPYKSFADSPFAPLSFAAFHLEDFEDGLLNTPGLSANAGTVLTSGSLKDSVDGDDGAIDGSGSAGNSYYVSTNAVTFAFDATALGGRLPTHVGLVWTDVGFSSNAKGDGYGEVVFEAFDPFGVSYGVFGPTLVGDGVFGGQTAEDLFLGAIFLGGISKITVSMRDSQDWEVDHIQYGVVPVPAALPIMAAALAGFGFAGWRRHRHAA
jgi:hypothetical protein